MRKERWKDIDGYKGLYKVSNYGKIKALPKVFYSGIRYTVKQKYPEKILKSWNSNGYRQVALCKNGTEIRFNIHTFVGKAFVKGYKKGLEINHKKGNRADNRAWMLEWVTASQNQKHSYDVLKRIIKTDHLIKVGKDNVNSVAIKAIHLITGKERHFFSQHGAARALRLNVCHVNSVLKGNRNKTGNYKFEYL